MKFLIIGLGSMGKRRIRNLLFNKIDKKNIAGFDLSKARALESKQKYGVKTFTDFNQANQNFKPNIYIISTPPHLHAEYFLKAVDNNINFFAEVASTDKGYQKLLLKLKKNKKIIAAPSCTYRYYQPIKLLKKLISQNKIGQILAFTHHMGQYLPDWHPWEDYRKFYVSKPESSALKEMFPFELQWLQWLVDDQIITVKGLAQKCSNLEMKANDVLAAVLQSKKNIIGTVLIDVISRAAFRSTRILGSTGVLEWEWQDHQIKIFTIKNKKWRIIPLDKGTKLKDYQTSTEEMYHQEIKVFLQALAGKIKYPYSFAEDWQNLKLLKKIFKKI